MELEEYLEAEVREIGLEMAFLDKLDNNRPRTLNKTNPPPQNCVLLGFPVRGIDMEEVSQNGGPINYQTMGTSLATLQSLLVPQLEQTNNPNS